MIEMLVPMKTPRPLIDMHMILLVELERRVSGIRRSYSRKRI